MGSSLLGGILLGGNEPFLEPEMASGKRKISARLDPAKVYLPLKTEIIYDGRTK
jgi:hypothetical protein